MKVFLDTNVWLSAIVFPGLCAELVLQLSASGHDILSSELVRAEAHAVLRRKFQRLDAATARFDSLWAMTTRGPDTAEPDDDADARLVSAAAAGGAALFVTGDQRVLDWDPHVALRILSPRAAWSLLFAPGAPAP